MNKFHAKKTLYKGITFDSIKECNYFKTLELQKKATKIADRVINIELQPLFNIVVNDQKVCKYKADFKVTYADNRIEF